MAHRSRAKMTKPTNNNQIDSAAKLLRTKSTNRRSKTKRDERNNVVQSSIEYSHADINKSESEQLNTHSLTHTLRHVQLSILFEVPKVWIASTEMHHRNYFVFVVGVCVSVDKRTGMCLCRCDHVCFFRARAVRYHCYVVMVVILSVSHNHKQLAEVYACACRLVSLFLLLWLLLSRVT